MSLRNKLFTTREPSLHFPTNFLVLAIIFSNTDSFHILLYQITEPYKHRKIKHILIVSGVLRKVINAFEFMRYTLNIRGGGQNTIFVFVILHKWRSLLYVKDMTQFYINETSATTHKKICFSSMDKWSASTALSEIL